MRFYIENQILEYVQSRKGRRTCDLFAHASAWPPNWTLDGMVPSLSRNMNERVTICNTPNRRDGCIEYQYERDFLRGKSRSHAQTQKLKRTNFSTSVLIKAPNLELEPRPALNGGCKKMKIDGVIPGYVQSSLRTKNKSAADRFVSSTAQT